MSNQTQTVTVRLQADVNAYKAALIDARRAGADMTVATDKRLRDLGATMTNVGTTLTRRVTLPLAALGAGAVYAAVQWESAWAGVTKTVDGTAEQMETLEAGLRDMATRLPATHAEIAAVAQAAGQLGVSVPNIADFTEVLVMLGEAADDIDSQQAAMQMARLMNIMGTGQGDVDRLASSLVWLGNNAAATEGEILNMSLRVSGAGTQLGMTEAEVMALSAALTAVGIRAEMGGTAISRVMLEIAGDVATGSNRLEQFASISGVTVEEFSQRWGDDAAGTLLLFLEGLARVESQGLTTFGVIDELALGELRVRDTLLRSTEARAMYNEYLEGSRQAYIDNTALEEEYANRAATTASQIQVLRNNLVELGIRVGSQLLPPLGELVGFLTDLFGAAQDLHPWITNVGIAFLVMLAAVGPMLRLGGMLLTNWGHLAAGARMLGSAFTTMRIHAMTVTTALGTAGLGGVALVATAALGTLAFGIHQNQQRAERARERVRAYTDAIRDLGDAVEGTAYVLNDLVRNDEGLRDALAAAELDVDALAAALQGSDADFEAFITRLREANDNGAAVNFELNRLEAILTRHRGAALGAAEGTEVLDEVLSDVDGEPVAEELGVVELALQDAEEAAKEAKEAFEAYLDVLTGSYDAFTTFIAAQQGLADAQRRVADAEFGVLGAQQALDQARREHGRNSREYLEATRDLEQAERDLEDAHLANIAAARDLERAEAELIHQVQTNGMTVEDAIAALDRWAEEGWITAEQHRMLSERIVGVGESLDAIDGKHARIYTTHEITERIARWEETGGTAVNSASGFQRRASGGHLAPGQRATVGEAGPELLTWNPDGSITVHPHDSPLTRTAMAGYAGDGASIGDYSVVDARHATTAGHHAAAVGAAAGSSQTTINMPFNGHDWSLEDAMQMAEIRLGWALTTRNDA